MGGGLAGSHDDIYWWIMLPVCIVGVIIGDGFLYAIGRLWGPRLLQYSWIKRRILPPDRLATIESNFQQYGVKLLLFARLTPGIRAPVFFTAGLTQLSLVRFLLADGLYAIPGVSLLFFLGYWFADSIVGYVQDAAKVKSVIVIVVIVAVVGYFTYRAFRKPVVTGDPKEIPPLVEQVTHKLEQMTSKIILPKTGKPGAGTETSSTPHSGDGQTKSSTPLPADQSQAPGQRSQPP
jgi:membrane protein DedA with SNARE-associated domain